MTDEHYPPRLITMLEAIWGNGFLSPGGPDEVARVIGAHDIRGMTILDIGCGAGGIDLALLRNHGAGHVLGIDVEDSVLTRALQLIAEADLTRRIGLVKVAPGPLPFPDHTHRSCKRAWDRETRFVTGRTAGGAGTRPPAVFEK